MEEITSVFVTPLSGYGNLKALASINFRGVILRGLKLMEKENTLWLGMPGKMKGEKWEDQFFFPESSIRQKILDAVVRKYRQSLNEPAMAAT